MKREPKWNWQWNHLFLTVAFVGSLFSHGCSSLPTAGPVPNKKAGLLDETRLAKANAGVQKPKAAHQQKSGSSSDLPVPAAREVNPAQLNYLAALKKSDLRWPLDQVLVTSPFGTRGKDFHEGIDLMAKSGTQVYAALAGVVLYSGSKIKGYGSMVVLRHRSGISTVYAHNSKLLVKKGEKVKKGQAVAVSGKSGRATGPHLHFEIRSGLKPVDPLVVLPDSPKRLVSKK